MGIFETTSPLATVRNAQNNGNNLPKPEVYANIGYPAQDPETGEKIYISLPYGVGIDTMQTLRAGNSDVMQAKNQLLIELQELAASLKPGEEIELPLTVTLRRKADPVTHTANDNAFIAQMKGLGIKKTA